MPERHRWTAISLAYLFSHVCFSPMSRNAVEAQATRRPDTSRNSVGMTPTTRSDVKSQLRQTGTGSVPDREQLLTSNKGPLNLLDTLQSEDAIENAKPRENLDSFASKVASVDPEKRVNMENKKALNKNQVNNGKEAMETSKGVSVGPEKTVGMKHKQILAGKNQVNSGGKEAIKLSSVRAPVARNRAQGISVSTRKNPTSVNDLPSSDKDVDAEFLRRSADFKVTFLSSSQGVLQSPRWGNGENYPPGLNVWERVDIPKGKTLRIAVQYLNLLEYSTTTSSSKNTNNNKDCNSVTEDVLSAYLVNTSNSRTLLWTACRSERPPPTVPGAHAAVDFHFTSKNKTYDTGAYAAGFKLWLTFLDARNASSSSANELQESLPPPQNRPWSDFVPGIRRKNSPADYCKGEGMVWTGGMCLKFLTPFAETRRKSWKEADKLCRKENATLPSPSTPQEWWALVDFVNGREFQRDGGSVRFYVGLRFGNSSPSGYERVPLYEGLGRWSSGSVSFFLRDVRPKAGKACTAFTKDHPSEVTSVDCDAVSSVPIVCQTDHYHVDPTGDSSSGTANMADSKRTVSPQAGSPPPSSVSARVDKNKTSHQEGKGGQLSRLVKCPGAGHFVQAYRACDMDCFGKSLASRGEEEEEAPPDWKSVFRNPLPSKRECPVPMATPPPYFTCDSPAGTGTGTGTTRVERVPYTWVCDGYADCWDESDEAFCHEPFECQGGRKDQLFACSGGWECIEAKKRCDGHRDCSDGSDESLTICTTANNNDNNNRLQDDGTFKLPDLLNTLTPPVLVGTNRHGRLTLRVLQEGRYDVTGKGDDVTDDEDVFFACPEESHFRCLLFCMPVYLRCNGVRDCPRGEDEASCGDEDGHRCPGYYRCRTPPSPPTVDRKTATTTTTATTTGIVKVCLHPDNVCDGVYHCPLLDDEFLCGDLSCPEACSCRYGHAFFCTGGRFAAAPGGTKYPNLRFLHAPGSGTRLSDASESRALVYLNLASCGIASVGDLTGTLYNLRTLDLSLNKIRVVGAEVLGRLPALRDLSLRGNPVTFPFAVEYGEGPRRRRTSLSSLQRLDLSLVWVLQIRRQDLSRLDLYNLRILNLSYSGLGSVRGEGGFQSLVSLRVLDLRGCPLNDYADDAFSRLVQLTELYVSSPSLCCPGNLPNGAGFSGVCSATHEDGDEDNDDSSSVGGRGRTTSSSSFSCDTLLHSNTYRLLLIVFASLILGGNAVSFVYRLFVNQEEKGHSCGVMVTHLSVSDFLMGLYLLIVGVADARYGDVYFARGEDWKGSGWCKAAGFLSLLSSEASAFFVCLLTLDRLAALRFPNSRLHFRKRSAQMTCAMTWFAGVFLAAVPLIETHWRFYGVKDTCLPLPTDARSFDGRDYSFAVLIMLNFVLFLVIAVGQALIFCAVRSKRKTLGVNSEYQSLERAITKRLIAIALTDFLVWFPVCLVGFLASDGVRMPRHVDTALSIVVLPLNSAINPFIYTFVMVREQQRKTARHFLESETSFMI